MPVEPMDIKVEGWEALASVLGIFKTMQETQSLPSVELTMDSKGVVKPTVKVYNANPMQAMEDCQLIFDSLRDRYGITQ